MWPHRKKILSNVVQDKRNYYKMRLKKEDITSITKKFTFGTKKSSLPLIKT